MTDKDKLEKLKKLADAMYYAAKYLTTDASRLHKAMDEYHKFVILEYHNRKEDSVNNGLDLGCGVIWKDIEPVSEDLENAAYQYANCFPRKFDMASMAFIKGANWQKQKDEIKRVHTQRTTISSSLNDYLCKAYSALYKGNGGRLSFARLQNMAIDITEWQKQKDAEALNQNALLYDARLKGIEIGKAEMKQQIMKDAVKGTTKFVGEGRDKMVKFICGDLNPDEYELNQRVKLIIIKED